MNKKVTAVLLATAIGACGISAGTQVPAQPSAQGGFLASPQPVQAAAASAAAKLAKEVEAAYGEDYVPNYKLSGDEIKNRYGVSTSWYSSAFAQVPMVSAHVDEVAIFKAKNATSKKKILKAVKAYQKSLKESTMQYPMNLLKIQGSKVYTNGNYVCFFMLGQISKSTEENGSDEDIIKAYQQQNKKAVNAVKKKLKK